MKNNYYYVELSDVDNNLLSEVGILTLDRVQNYITEWVYNDTREALQKILDGENPLFLKKEDKFNKREQVQYLMTMPNYNYTDGVTSRVYIVWATNKTEALGAAIGYEKDKQDGE